MGASLNRVPTPNCWSSRGPIPSSIFCRPIRSNRDEDRTVDLLPWAAVAVGAAADWLGTAAGAAGRESAAGCGGGWLLETGEAVGLLQASAASGLDSVPV